MFRPDHCSLYLLCSQERERKKLISLFSLFIATGCGGERGGMGVKDIILSRSWDF